jgi:hypothetical protein
VIGITGSPERGLGHVYRHPVARDGLKQNCHEDVTTVYEAFE